MAPWIRYLEQSTRRQSSYPDALDETEADSCFVWTFIRSLLAKCRHACKYPQSVYLKHEAV